jgi:radical SAM protein with 4Fe4S-binding SPASM domain
MISLISQPWNSLRAGLSFEVPPRIWSEHGADCGLAYSYPGVDEVLVKRQVPVRPKEAAGKYILTGEIDAAAPITEISLELNKPGRNTPIILGNWVNSQGRWESNPGVIPYPTRMIGFNLTNQCNLQCAMCWQKNRTPVMELSADAVNKVIKAVKLFGKPPVYLWGGEPFIHHDFWRIIQVIKENGFFCIVNTNGSMLEKFAGQIIDANIDMIIVSLDGNQEIHNQIRGSQSIFQRVTAGLEKIKRLKAKRPLITINCVVTGDNYPVLEEMIAVKNHVGAEYLEFQALIFFERETVAGYKRQFMKYFGYEPTAADTYPGDKGSIDIDQFYAIMERIKAHQDPRIRFFPYVLNDFQSVRNYYENPRALGIRCCENISKAFWVEPNGDVIPCSTFPDYVAGNINEADFFDIWNGIPFQDFRKKLQQSLFPICYRCCDLYKIDLFQGR